MSSKTQVVGRLSDNADKKEIVQFFVKNAKLNSYEDTVRITNQELKRINQIVRLNYEIPSFRNEGAHALFNAVKTVLGNADMNTESGASGDNPPELISITLPDGTEAQTPWGSISLPGFEGSNYISMSYGWDDNILHVTAEISKVNEAKVKEIIEEANNQLVNEGLYCGRAIELSFDEDGQADEPKFLNLGTVDSSKILFSKDINDGLVPILSRIKNREACLEQDLDIKLGVLMEGTYGTGKTLTAFHIAKIAIEYGWTFIYLKDCKHVAKTLKIAENYAKKGKGVIVFTEDIDQALRGERGKTIQDIVNTLDGGDNKNLPIISIFTTNHIELIEPTFMRGKRIGSLIKFGPLDEDTAKQFIEKLVVNSKGEQLMEEGNKDEAIQALCGIVPAFASEVIDKAKAYMINRGSSKISNEDIVKAADSYRNQMTYATIKTKEVGNGLEHALQTLFNSFGVNKAEQETINKAMTKKFSLEQYVD